ncbi:MAG: NAD(P)/FAD-dependent oxidoreductase [bacterium]|nr:NAD(P)/FAD-dependent oxidoreductase [bacterium]
MDNKYDVIIVGGGPAGLYAAYKIEKNYKVIVFEKDDIIGEPIICAEGISNNTLKQFFKETDLPFVRNRFSKLIVKYKDLEAKVDIPDMGLIIDRSKFEQYIAQKVKDENNFEIRTDSFVIDAKVENDFVKVTLENGEEFVGKILIIADGVESYLPNKVGINSVCNLNDIYSCYQQIIYDPKIKDEEIIFDFTPSVAPGGYLWVFPRGKNEANFGLGITSSMDCEKPYKLLNEYKEKNYPEAKILREFPGCVSVNQLSKMYTDRVMVVGDSARAADPITGGGIDNALRTANFAAIVANSVLKGKDFTAKRFAQYQELVEKDNSYSIKKQNQLREMLLEMSEEEKDKFFLSATNLFNGKKILSTDFYSTIYSFKSSVKALGMIINFMGTLMKDKYILKIIMRLLWK